MNLVELNAARQEYLKHNGQIAMCAMICEKWETAER